MRITLLCKILIAGVGSSTALACNNIHNDPAFEFYYYPARNVYYDVSNARYIYSLNGGRTWDTLYKKAEAGSPTLGKKEIIYSQVANPWDSNDVHIKRYEGYLLDLPSIDSNTAEAIVVSERKPATKAKSVTASTKDNSENNKSEKKPGFFKRLFGKKH